MRSPAKSLSLQRRRTRLTNSCHSSLPKDQPAHTLPLPSTSLSWNQPLQGGSSTPADSGCSLLSTACLAQSSQSHCQCLSLPSPTGNHLYSEDFKGAVLLCLVVSFLPSCSCKHGGMGEGIRLHLPGGEGSNRGWAGTMPGLKCWLCSEIQFQLGRQPLKHPLPLGDVFRRCAWQRTAEVPLAQGRDSVKRGKPPSCPAPLTFSLQGPSPQAASSHLFPS